MISLKSSYRPISQTRIGLGQFSSFINPYEVTGDSAPTTPPPTPTPSGPDKTVTVLGGLWQTAISAATAYVGISYGLQRGNSDLERALGWTVGVVGSLSALANLVGTTVVAALPGKS